MMKATCTLIDLSPVWDSIESLINDVYENSDDEVARDQFKKVPFKAFDDIIIVTTYMIANNLMSSNYYPLKPSVVSLMNNYLDGGLGLWLKRSLPSHVTPSNLSHCKIVNRVLVINTRPDRLLTYNAEERKQPPYLDGYYTTTDTR